MLSYLWALEPIWIQTSLFTVLPSFFFHSKLLISHYSQYPSCSQELSNCWERFVLASLSDKIFKLNCCFVGWVCVRARVFEWYNWQIGLKMEKCKWQNFRNGIWWYTNGSGTLFAGHSNVMYNKSDSLSELVGSHVNCITEPKYFSPIGNSWMNLDIHWLRFL